MTGAQRMPLPGGRWHFQHGPIDCVIAAEGDAAAVAAAHDAAFERFERVLGELVGELAVLRRRVDLPKLDAPDDDRPTHAVGRAADRGEADVAAVAVAATSVDANPLRGPIARRMWSAVAPFAADYITPMAAVAGSVADELIALYRRDGIDRAWVNNGGDIAIHLAAGKSTRIGLFADLSTLDLRTVDGHVRTDAAFTVHAAMPIRGVATSGWRGRSFSLGIADSVTVLAATAAEADAAATVIANAVNVDDDRIERRPASQVKDDSDLGELLVTVDVPTLSRAAVAQALEAGSAVARRLQRQGSIVSAMLVCQGLWASAEAPQSLPDTPLVQYLLNEQDAGATFRMDAAAQAGHS
ncbi:MAG: ApbE family lipoprotein [Rhizobacter sp.]|nr:ApbE family lipoprotein [Rhizobacter sp.]